MNLNTEKNIELCRKALATKQLQYYAKLCELYSELAKLNPHVRTPEQVQERYSSALSLAAKGDLSFLDSSENLVMDTRFLGKNFSEDEIKIFKQYAFATNRLREFQEGNNILSEAIFVDSNNNVDIDSSVVEQFRDYMQTKSKSTIYFDKFIDEHSRQGVGHRYLLATKQAISRINSIDCDHVPISKFIKDLNPVAFGSTLSTVYHHDKIVDGAHNFFDSQDKREFREKPGIIHEAAYKLGHSIHKTYTANKQIVRRVIIGSACAALLWGGASYINDSREFKNLNVTTNYEQGYQTHISSETKAQLTAIRTAIENAENSPTQPTAQELNVISHNLDEVIDLVMSDLVTEAFEEKNPDCKVTAVDTRYDKTVNMYKSASSEPDPENFVTITYINKNGEEKKTQVHQFNSFRILLAGSPIDQSFADEYYLDSSSNYVDGNKNFIEQGQDTMEKLHELKTKLKNTEHLAATQMIFTGGNFFIDPSLKTVMPERIQSFEDQKTPITSTQFASNKNIEDELDR